MLGDRDAELALIVEDECFSKALRCHLARSIVCLNCRHLYRYYRQLSDFFYREHLGLEETDDAVDNPVECYMVHFEFGKNCWL